MGHLAAERLLLLGSFHCIQQSSSLPLRTKSLLNIRSRMIFFHWLQQKGHSVSPKKKIRPFPQLQTNPNHQLYLTWVSPKKKQPKKIRTQLGSLEVSSFHMHLKGDVIIVSHLVRDLAFTTSTHSPFGPFAKRVKYWRSCQGKNPRKLPDPPGAWQRRWTWYKLDRTWYNQSYFPHKP